MYLWWRLCALHLLACQVGESGSHASVLDIVQGMSDLASPLLVIQKDEAQAYICFCGLMNCLRSNFSADGTAMMTQFRHLAELLQVHDTVFYEYLQGINAHDLFFCYRWLLLQLKREFPFEDALYMLEVIAGLEFFGVCFCLPSVLCRFVRGEP